MKDLLFQASDPIIAELFKLTGDDPKTETLNLDKLASLMRETDRSTDFVASGSDENVAYVLGKLGIDADKIKGPIEGYSLLRRIDLDRLTAEQQGSTPAPIAASRSGANEMGSAKDSARKYAESMNALEARMRENAKAKNKGNRVEGFTESP